MITITSPDGHQYEVTEDAMQTFLAGSGKKIPPPDPVITALAPATDAEYIRFKGSATPYMGMVLTEFNALLRNRIAEHAAAKK